MGGKKNRKLAIICIDMQKEYFEKERPLRVPDGSQVLANVSRLINTGRDKGVLVIHVRHISKNPFDSTFRAGTPSIEFIEGAFPREGEHVVTKSRPGAFYGTGLHEILCKNGINTVAICGLLSFMCCDTTAREAHARGYNVLFVKDATAAININNIPAETIHNVTCAVQGWLFSRVLTTDELIDFLSRAHI